MKVEIPDYFLKSFIRHFERITENCKASPSDIKTSEALRLGKKDVIKLKRFINQKSIIYETKDHRYRCWRKTVEL